jgi:hypothetical protein
VLDFALDQAREHFELAAVRFLATRVRRSTHRLSAG